MCWPQDLFEVGQYDSENNFWGNTSDDDSWETEDETSELGGMPQPHLTANLERARVAMARLEEMFIINPNLQSQEVMKKLLMVYKKCRYLDRLMNTSFFHESHFNGLVERVRKSGNQTTAERVQDQKNRLFKCDSIHQEEDEAKKPQKKANLLEITKSSSNSNEENSFCSFESTKSLSCSSAGCTGSKNQLSVQQKNNISTSSDISSIPDDPESRISLSPTNKVKTPKKNQDHDPDSGITITLNAERKESSFMISSQENFPNECVCAKLCSLIKVQLVKALQEINNRYCPTDTFKEIVEFDEQKDTEPAQEATVQNLALVHENSVDDLAEKPISDPGNFLVLEEAPNSHKYHLTVFHTTKPQEFFKAVQKEHRLLRNSLPSGVWVRTFEDRLDLLSVMIEGPKNTPYEEGVFVFDLQLSHDYPRTPPLCHYISYCTDRLNPNLYEDGKVCVSLLGTWSGKVSGFLIF
jgi:ubiquitin-conjugating enzyme E2 O